ncbi:hypothetical protein FRB94_012705 [Tulasnella sp. JGI-2019a]|nr:hypothetical protein FRB94_012705 [Tulasnella sp. JGI-2019a]
MLGIAVPWSWMGSVIDSHQSIQYETHIDLYWLPDGGYHSEKVIFWDPSGTEEVRSLLGPYLQGQNGIRIVYDITDQKSFQGALAWNPDYATGPYKSSVRLQRRRKAVV